MTNNVIQLFTKDVIDYQVDDMQCAEFQRMAGAVKDYDMDHEESVARWFNLLVDLEDSAALQLKIVEDIRDILENE